MTTLCRLPATLDHDIDIFDHEVGRFLKGELTGDEFKGKRVPWGIYEQRRDGYYMLRTRVPGGSMTVEQARAIAGLSKKHGSGVVHVTTRENIQFHDVPVADIPAIMRSLREVGTACKSGGGNTARNVVACPLAGVCPHEAFDVMPYVIAVTEHLLALPGIATLPRKFKVAFSGCRGDCALATVTDIGLVATMQDGQPGFIIYGGGGMGGGPRLADRLTDWIPASDSVRAVEAIRRIFDRLGDRTNRARARLRFVAAKIGADEFKALFHRELAEVIASGVHSCIVSTDHINHQVVSTSAYSPLSTRVIQQRQPGFVALLLSLPLGQIRWQDLLGLADLAERFSTEKCLHATPNQQLVIRSVKESDLTTLRDAIVALNPGLLKDGAINRIVACTGAATCRLGIGRSRGAAVNLAAALEQACLPADILENLDIRINGCANCCGQHPVGDIGLSGALPRQDGQAVPSYRIHLGARRGEGRTRFGEHVGTVPARAVPASLVELLRDYSAKRQGAETLSEFFDRQGKDYFKSLLAGHATLPPYAASPELYPDWKDPGEE